MKPNFTAGNVLLRKVQSKGSKKSTRYQKSQALKDLEKLLIEAKRLKYPNTPPHYLVADTHEDKTANGLTKAIIAFIRLRGGQSERISTTGRPINRTQTFTDTLGHTRQIGSIEWVKGTTTNGSADISATIAGCSVKVEVKIGTDRMSEAQHQYQKSIESAGGVYFIARTFEEFVTWYQTFKP